MFSRILLDHFEYPRNPGELPPPAVRVRVSNPACGDELVLSALCTGDTLSEVRYLIRGCTAAIAAGSILTTMLTGVEVGQASRIQASDIEQALGGLPAASRHAAQLCADGVAELMRQLSS